MKVDSQKVEEVLTRAVEKIVDRENLKELLLSGKKLRIKHGVDPTGEKIHLGRAIQLWKLRQFQDLGHKIVLIIGDFTAQVGDPSDKPKGRQGLSEKEIAKNMKSYLEQFSKILDIGKAEIHYNSEWFDKIKLKEFLSLATSFSVQQLIQRRNFKERWKKGEAISLKEITYPLLQGYDSAMVKADVELGGYDQLFNLNMGRDVQKLLGQKPQDIIVLKMLDGLDGRKMSTSWGNVVNIADEPNDMYGKIMSMKDDMLYSYFELCALATKEELGEIKKRLKQQSTNPRDLKAELAHKIVALYHNEEVAKKAEQEFNKVFQSKGIPSDIKIFFTPKNSYPIVELLSSTKMATSKSEAKRLIQQKGVKVNGEVVDNIKEDIIVKEGMIVQIGKRKFIKLTKSDGHPR